MTGPSDPELRDRLTRLANAVPLEHAEADDVLNATATTHPVRRTSWSTASFGFSPAPLIVIAIAGLVGTSLFAAAGLGPFRPGDTGAGPVSATTTDGDFTLTISSPKGRYGANEAIDVSASLAYGPGGAVGIAHGLGADDGPLSFSVDEPIMGDLHLSGSIRDACRSSTLEHDAPIVAHFAKSAGFDGSDPLASSFVAYLQDPEFRLPPGTWHVRVEASFSIGSCGDDRRYEMSAAIPIVVDGPVATTAATEPSGSATPTASSEPQVSALAFPGVCPEIGVDINQCAGFAAWAVGQAGVEPGHVQAIEMAMTHCPGVPPCPSGATGFIVDVRVASDQGAASDEVADCTRVLISLGGINLLCVSRVEAVTGRRLDFPLVYSTVSGYHDVPCAGEAPQNPCATPLPTIEPSALAASMPLAIGSLQIPIDHAGRYSVVLGQASLPNGILTAASADVVSSPADPLVSYDGYQLVVKSLDGGQPFDNYYQHGWRPGTERIQVSLEFTILMFSPGAAVEVSNIDVH